MMKVIGVTPYDFVPEGEKERRRGMTIHAVELVQEGKGIGERPVKLSMSEDTFAANERTNGPVVKMIGHEVDVVYNRYGKATAIRLAAPARQG
jgi:hypothetical protein